jgi:hypothetical protein
MPRKQSEPTPTDYLHPVEKRRGHRFLIYVIGGPLLVVTGLIGCGFVVYDHLRTAPNISPTQQSSSKENDPDISVPSPNDVTLVSMSAYQKHVASLRDQPLELKEFHTWANHKKVTWDCYVASISLYSESNSASFSIRPDHDFMPAGNVQPSESFFTEIYEGSAVDYQVRVLREGDHITAYGRLDDNDRLWLSEIRRRK